jgi:hypothetical protein
MPSTSASRLMKECGDATVEEQVRHAWRLVYGREPVTEELEAGAAFLTMQTAHYTVEPAKFEKTAGPAETTRGFGKVDGCRRARTCADERE